MEAVHGKVRESGSRAQGPTRQERVVNWSCVDEVGQDNTGTRRNEVSVNRPMQSKISETTMHNTETRSGTTVYEAEGYDTTEECRENARHSVYYRMT